MTGMRSFTMEWVTFLSGSVGIPDDLPEALLAYGRCEDHPLTWLLKIVIPGINNDAACAPPWWEQ